MKRIFRILGSKRAVLVALTIFSAIVMAVPADLWAQTPPVPAVAIHVSELTQTLETTPVSSPGIGATGFEWWYTSWHYFVPYESLKEALRSDGTPFVTVSDADIAAGNLLYPDGSPRYPILISLASEATDSNEIAPLRDYVDAGGFLFIGSSAFTRMPDGTNRGDFVLANEMGLHMAGNDTLLGWYQNTHFTKVGNHRLAANIPAGVLSWYMPLTAEEIPLGVSPSHTLYGPHWVFTVSASGGATVIANGDSGPLLTVTPYGQGNFIYHGAIQPLIAHGGTDSGMYSYLIYRNAIEWAFEAANLPIIKLSPWRYDYDAAFIVRHDFENSQESIRSIEDSASFENSHGAKGDYYFCTGTLRSEMTGTDQSDAIAGLRDAVTTKGATIGSHNGGLQNPVNTSLLMSDFDYWHWGPDEALDVTTFPTGSYVNGKDYAQASILMSFEDLQGWLAGLNNGRAGCGVANDCPRIWTAPYFNATRDNSYGILEDLGVKSAGEQKIGPFPHWTLSTSLQTAGKRYPHISLPAADWYVGSDIAQELANHTSESMQAAVDFYYGLGALVSIYGHIPSEDGNIMGEYVTYCASKPRIWASNAVGIYDWWQVRSNVVVTPTYGKIGNIAFARATITGATDPDTAIEVAIHHGSNQVVSNPGVFINDTPADPANYRVIGDLVKIKVGASASSAEVRYNIAPNAPTVSGATPTNNTTPTWTWSSGGGGGNGTYRFRLDNSDLTTGTTTTTSTSYTPASPLSATTHTLYVQEQDDAGNWSASGSFAILIDVTPPDTFITSQPSNPTNQTSASFSLSATEAGSTFECQIDGGAYTACTNPAVYSSLASNTTHTFSVRATDPAGNTDATPATYSWLIDTSSVGVTISTTASNPTRTAPIPVTVTFGKPVSDFVNTDVTFGNGVMTGGSFSGSGTTYTFTVAPSGDGLVTINIAAGVAHDAASNPNGAASLSITYDATAPTLAISAPSPTIANSASGPVTYTVTYTGADGVTLANANITLNKTGTADGTVAVSGTGNITRTVTITNITGYGALGISIAANTASDTAGNSASAAGPSTTFTVDNSSGDFNGDGVDLNDALKALRIAAGLDTPTASDIARGDVAPLVNGTRHPDGKIDLADVVAILRKYVGLPSW